MDTPNPGAPRRPPVVLDMTPEGEFRDAAPRPATWLDRALGKVGGVAVLLALGAGALVFGALALLALSVLVPVLLVAAVVGGGTLYWRFRRAAARGGVRFVVVRR